jgi:plasmid maintenance system killer protein
MISIWLLGEPYLEVAVSGNLRFIFSFDGEDAVDVDLKDYH